MTSSVLEQLQAHKAGVTPLRPQEHAALSRPIVGSYSRISDAYEDAATGVTEDGVKRQQKVNSLLAEARGWDLHERLYVDNSVSAFKTGVVRDDFEALLEDLTAGVIDGIVCYNLDRLARRVSDLERVIEVYDAGRKNGRPMFFATNEGSIDLSSDDGITLARVMVAFANKASRDTARRVALKHQESRDSGRNVGGSRPFGWSWAEGDDGRRVHVIEPAESAAIRDATTRLIDGTTSWYALMLEWNEQGLRTPRGKEWATSTLKQMLTSPRLAGWLVHKGKIAVHSQTGRLVRSQAPAILTDEEFEALLVATDTRAKGFSDASGRHRYLLSGILRCASCGARLSANRRRFRGSTQEYVYYVCQKNGTRSGDGETMACGKVSASARELDAMVEELVLPVVIQHTNGVAVNEEKPHQRELMELQDERTGWTDKLRNRLAPADVALPIINDLDKRAEALGRAQAEWVRRRAGLARGVGVTNETWPALSVEERRAHVSRYVEAIYVSPATQRGNRFDRSRVSDPVWRTEAGRAALLAPVPD